MGGSKVAKNLRFEARQLLAIVATIFENLRLMGSKMELLIKKMCNCPLFVLFWFCNGSFAGENIHSEISWIPSSPWFAGKC